MKAPVRTALAAAFTALVVAVLVVDVLAMSQGADKRLQPQPQQRKGRTA